MKRDRDSARPDVAKDGRAPAIFEEAYGLISMLYEAVRGVDHSPVRPVGQKPPRVVGNHVFDEDVQAVSVVEGALYVLVETAGRVLRQRCLAARRTIVMLDFSDGRRCTRQRALRPATANDMVLYEAARSALYLAWHRRVRIRHLRLVCDRLAFPPAQRGLFASETAAARRNARLVSALDGIRERFGRDAIKVGRTLAA